MTGWLLDTNILSELRRLKPEARVVAFVGAQPLEHLYVVDKPVITQTLLRTLRKALGAAGNGG